MTNASRAGGRHDAPATTPMVGVSDTPARPLWAGVAVETLDPDIVRFVLWCGHHDASRQLLTQALVGLKPTEYRVALRIAYHARGWGVSGDCFPSQGTIATHTGVARPHVVRAVQGLVSRGVIVIWRARRPPYGTDDIPLQHYAFRGEDVSDPTAIPSTPHPLVAKGLQASVARFPDGTPSGRPLTGPMPDWLIEDIRNAVGHGDKIGQVAHRFGVTVGAVEAAVGSGE